ncbi:SRPBCC family protein [Granulicoccus sp. GXG6511]|uniref:SRPBCC family protein n=1 Tax=Granulicoccus sp. GXG6511 TaxID=3381351 RepID=UPI003D7E105D
MWLSTETGTLPAAPTKVWDIVRDITLLPRWHHFFASVTLEDPETALHPGHGHYVPSGWRGIVHARTAGPFTTSVGERSVVLRQPQPGRGEQIFSWWVAPGDQGTRIIQRIRVSGRYGLLFTRLVGHGSARGFDEDVRKLGLLLDRH